MLCVVWSAVCGCCVSSVLLEKEDIFHLSHIIQGQVGVSWTCDLVLLYHPGCCGYCLMLYSEFPSTHGKPGEYETSFTDVENTWKMWE